MEHPGYAGKILRLDLTSGTFSTLPTSDFADRFLGGRGIAAKLYWDEVPPSASAFDPANALVFSTGPLAGIPVIGGSRWNVCGKSPATSPEHFSHCNLGGDWGLRLKSAGYDSLVLLGAADRPSYVLIDAGGCQLRPASHLWGKGAIQTREILKTELGGPVSVVAIGPAGENRATMASLLADDDAAGASGMAAVMGSKNVKAIAVRATRRKSEAALPDRLREYMRQFRSMGRAPVTSAGSMVLQVTGPGTRKAPCYGCIGSCLRRTYQAEDGVSGKFMCQAATFYQPMAEMHYGPGPEVPFHAAKLCDDYGLDTMAISLIILWLARCARAGILNDENTGIPISKLGTMEFIDTLVTSIALRQGFGDILARGVEAAADCVGPQAKELLAPHMSKAGLPNVSDPRLYINSALLYAFDPKPPLAQMQEITRILFKWLEWRRGEPHSYVSNEVARRIASRYWGSEVAADFSTIEGKALAAKQIQDRQHAKDCLILCSFLWPIMDSEFAADNVGDSALESKLLSAATGREIDEEGLNAIGERVFNLNRAVLVREGHRGIEDDTLPERWYEIPLKADIANPELLVPVAGDEVVCRRGLLVHRGDFEAMRDEYYRLRQWDAVTGLQRKAKLESLGLGDVARSLEEVGSAL